MLEFHECFRSWKLIIFQLSSFSQEFFFAFDGQSSHRGLLFFAFTHFRAMVALLANFEQLSALLDILRKPSQ